MGRTTLAVILLLEIGIIAGEICQFYNLDADCRYRIDGVCLAHIKAAIDQCQNPIAVRFTITCENPVVRFSHVFASSDKMVPVPGFDRKVDLQVKLSNRPDNEINIEADFHVEGLARADFMNNDVKLMGLEDHCPILNQAAKIAVGVMCALLAVVLAMLVVLFMIRRQRQRARAAQNASQLVANAEQPAPSTPPPSRQGEVANGNAMVRFSEIL